MHILADLVDKIKTGKLTSRILCGVITLILKLSVVDVILNYLVKIEIDLIVEHSLKRILDEGIDLRCIGKHAALKYLGLNKYRGSHKVCHVLRKVGYSAVTNGGSLNFGWIENLLDKRHFLIRSAGIFVGKVHVKSLLPEVIGIKTALKKL